MVYNFKTPKILLLKLGVRMTQRQNDMVRHFGTEGHFGTATK